MTPLVFGHSGQVARELRRLHDVVALGRDQCDIDDMAAIEATIRAHNPVAVINAAAYTAVDQAEKEVPLALRINGDAPAAMARACALLDIPFVHISTDYVFDGSGDRPWSPDDSPAPLNAYGHSKLAGEDGICAAGGRYAILRTSWIFSRHGNNFAKTMVQLAEQRSDLSVVTDQIGGPTPAVAVAKACLTIANQLANDPGKSGTYHFSGAPDVSWFEFAQAIFARSGHDITVYPILSSEYPVAAPRPLNSRLDCKTTMQVFGIERPDWRPALDDIVPGCSASPAGD